MCFKSGGATFQFINENSNVAPPESQLTVFVSCEFGEAFFTRIRRVGKNNSDTDPTIVKRHLDV